MRASQLARVLEAIVVSVAACDDDAARVVPDAGPDVQTPFEAGADADADVADAPIDSYVDWCEAGPPSLPSTAAVTIITASRAGSRRATRSTTAGS